MKLILKTERKLTEADNSSVNKIMETKKMHSLEKLSSLELQAIKEDLLRQRDLMSKELFKKTMKNKSLEKERENVHNAIQEEGKTLIKKCNSLRREGLELVYKIGLAKKEAEELTSEIKKNFPNQRAFLKKSNPYIQQDKSLKKRQKDLPLEAYQKHSSLTKVKKAEVDEENHERGKTNSYALLNYLMKEAHKLYTLAEKNGEDLDGYMVR